MCGDYLISPFHISFDSESFVLKKDVRNYLRGVWPHKSVLINLISIVFTIEVCTFVDELHLTILHPKRGLPNSNILTSNFRSQVSILNTPSSIYVLVLSYFGVWSITKILRELLKQN